MSDDEAAESEAEMEDDAEVEVEEEPVTGIASSSANPVPMEVPQRVLWVHACSPVPCLCMLHVWFQHHEVEMPGTGDKVEPSRPFLLLLEAYLHLCLLEVWTSLLAMVANH